MKGRMDGEDESTAGMAECFNKCRAWKGRARKVASEISKSTIIYLKNVGDLNIFEPKVSPP